MPVTFPPPPLAYVGPGITIRWQSDFIGPLPSGTTVSLQIFPLTSSELPYWSASEPTAGTTGVFHVLVPTTTQTIASYGNDSADGQAVRVEVTLSDALGQLDTGEFETTWSSTQGLGRQAALIASSPVGGGFTSSDRAQLESVAAATIPSSFIDALRLVEISPGPTDQPVTSDLSEFCYGVTVRITAFPADTILATPDMDYSMRSFASLRVFRSADVFMRVPIHRTSQIVPLGPAHSELYLFTSLITGWAPGLTLEVDWASGVSGQVFLMRAP